MKLTVCEFRTTIEADAKELAASNTLAQNLAMTLARCFQPHFEDDCDVDTADDEEEEDQE